MDKLNLPAHLSLDAKDLINSLLQKNPSHRIHLNQIFEHPFITKYNVSI